MMANKKQTLEQAAKGEGYLGKCDDFEPVFVLCGRDPIAASLIKRWAKRYAYNSGNPDHPKVKEALEVVKDFRRWQLAHNPQPRDKIGREAEKDYHMSRSLDRKG